MMVFPPRIFSVIGKRAPVGVCIDLIFIRPPPGSRHGSDAG
jgi:hypothetical protein